jgi:hypothetical protein
MADARSGPEPDGWELLRILENNRVRYRDEMTDMRARMVSKEVLDAELKRLADNLGNQVDDVNKRVDFLVNQRQITREFRRNIYVVVIGIAGTAVATLILAVLHLA